MVATEVKHAERYLLGSEIKVPSAQYIVHTFNPELYKALPNLVMTSK
jgi:hypothetical protein